VNELRNFEEVVAVVGVTHNDVAASRSCDAGAQGGSVSTLLHMEYARTMRLGDLDRSVRGTVVGDDHFSGQGTLGKSTQGFVDADAERIGLVQTGDDDGDFRSLGWNSRVS
jgi:hypothetical protein